MSIKVKKIKRENCIYFFLIYCCIALIATYMLGLPRYFVYTIDILNMALALYCLYDCQLRISKQKNKELKIVMLLLVTSIFIGFLLNHQSIFLLVWGARNNYRGILFMFSCIYLMKDVQKDEALVLLERLFWIHAILVMYQYFVMGYKGDLIGGIFGITQGGNSGNNLILCIFSSIAFWKYLNEKSNISKLLIKLACTFGIAAFAELKFFFVEVILIAILLLVLNGKFSKKIKTVFVLICGLIIGLYMLYSIFPQWVGYFTINRMLELLLGGRELDGTSIDRFSSLPELYHIFYANDGLLKSLFGYGLGSADYSLSISLLRSPIYTQYSSTGYAAFHYAFLYIELGIVGFVLFIIFLLVPIWSALKRLHEDSYNSLVVVIGVICLLLLFYDVTMKIEPQYFAYFMLSMTFWKKTVKSENINYGG